MDGYWPTIAVSIYLLLDLILLQTPLAILFVPAWIAELAILKYLPGSSSWAFSSGVFALTPSFLGWLIASIIIMLPILLINWLVVRRKKHINS